MKNNKSTIIDTDYQNIGYHTAPTREDVETGDAALLSDVSELYADFYNLSNDRLESFYPGASEEEYQQIKDAQDNPEAEIKIYRAVPLEVNEINTNDWVAITREYADDHGEDNLKDGYHVLESTVKAGELVTEGNSIAEWSYVGEQTLTPKMDLYDDITDLLTDSSFVESVREAVEESDNLNIEEYIRECASELLDTEIDQDTAVDYLYHIESNALAKQIADPTADIKEDMDAVRGAIAMAGDEAFMAADKDRVIDMAEKKALQLNPEYVNEFINGDNVESVVNACETLDGGEAITEMTLNDAISYCEKNLEGEIPQDQIEDVARFYRANQGSNAAEEARNVWKEKLEKIDDAKVTYEDALYELNDTLQGGLPVSKDLKETINESGNLLIDNDPESFEKIHSKVEESVKQGSKQTMTSDDIARNQYQEMKKVIDRGFNEEPPGETESSQSQSIQSTSSV